MLQWRIYKCFQSTALNFSYSLTLLKQHKKIFSSYLFSTRMQTFTQWYVHGLYLGVYLKAGLYVGLIKSTEIIFKENDLQLLLKDNQ